MKKHLFVLALCLGIAPAILGQEGEPTVKKKRNQKHLEVVYNVAHISHNLSLNYRHYFGRHGITIGTKYHLGTKIRNNSSRFDEGRFFFTEPLPTATSEVEVFFDRFGLTLGYQYQLQKKPTWLNPYLYYQLQPSFSLQFRKYGYTSAGFTVFEHGFGVGVLPVLNERWKANLSLGFGAAVIHDERGYVGPKPAEKNPFSERMFQLRFGIVYQLVKQP